jgi:hypothetical protein
MPKQDKWRVEYPEEHREQAVADDPEEYELRRTRIVDEQRRNFVNAA